MQISHNEPEISLILPAFNEAATISGTVSEVIRYFEERGLRHEIIVAADGNDGTRELVAQKFPAVRVIGDSARRGKGRGIREGVFLATGAIIGFADADNKVPISEYDKIRPWFSQGYQVVIGSRAMPDSSVERRQPLYRRIGSKGFAVFMQTLIGLPGISDTQCGFKFFTRKAALEVFRRQKIDGYMFDVEILGMAQRLGYRIQQVPIRWRDDGDSRFYLGDAIRDVIELFHIRFLLGRH